MKRHVFLTERPQPIPRWMEAFPDARLLCSQGPDKTGPADLADASVIWLHATGDEPAVSTWVSAVRASAQHVPIVVMSNVPEDEQGMAVLAAGASGYCSALTLPTVLQQVARVVEQGGLWVGPRLMRRLMEGLASRSNAAAEPALDMLSERERQVAVAVARGATNKEIARVMGITERTVKAHLASIYNKLGVDSRAAAIAIAAQKGWLEPEN